ncbi:MAG: hypothetical protein KatS3mg002_0424 [Candidatus Woesearchaeota archaeon]|nr:MAG: hypothetical protein KatS3mg002_0424 [Candidatus Woesearchaeota archaeon]
MEIKCKCPYCEVIYSKNVDRWADHPTRLHRLYCERCKNIINNVGYTEYKLRLEEQRTTVLIS